MLSFNKELLKRRLDGLSRRSRTAFALACAEALMPLYNAFSERGAAHQWEYLRLIANNLWKQALNNSFITDREFLNVYQLLSPNDNWPISGFTLLNPLAENAVLALGSAAECHDSDDGENAVLAAEQAYEAVDYLVQNTDGLDYRNIDGEEAILKSNLVQMELKRQADALSILERHSKQSSELTSAISLLREQSAVSGENLKKAAQSLIKLK